MAMVKAKGVDGASFGWSAGRTCLAVGSKRCGVLARLVTGTLLGHVHLLVAGGWSLD